MTDGKHLKSGLQIHNVLCRWKKQTSGRRERLDLGNIRYLIAEARKVRKNRDGLPCQVCKNNKISQANSTGGESQKWQRPGSKRRVFTEYSQKNAAGSLLEAVTKQAQIILRSHEIAGFTA